MNTYAIHSVLKQIQNSQHFLVTTDSTPDLSHQELNLLVTRYLGNSSNIKERDVFLKDIPSKICQAVCDFILDKVQIFQKSHNSFLL